MTKPTWKGTDLRSPITKIAIPLLAIRDGNGYPSGTACVIGPWLAITARHVVEDHFQHFDGSTPGVGAQASYQVCTYVTTGDGKVLPFFVQRTWASALSDIA